MVLDQVFLNLLVCSKCLAVESALTCVCLNYWGV